MHKKIIIQVNDNSYSDISDKATAISCLKNHEEKTINDFKTLGVHYFEFSNHDNGEDETVFTLLEENGKCHIQTYNAMGVLRLQDGDIEVTLEIHSRFDSNDQQYFLMYMLSRIFGGQLTDWIYYSNAPMWHLLLVFLFRYRLQDAYAQGVFKKYIRHEHNNEKFRGMLNLPEHLRKNIPFCGVLAYTTHEFSYDNIVTHLIRHTLHSINRDFPRLLSGAGLQFAEACRVIEQHTPTWHKRDILSCIHENQRPIRHPYYTAYEPLRQICLSILKKEGASLYEAKTTNKAEGVLFNGSKLWENYLWGLFKEVGWSHPDNGKRNPDGFPQPLREWYPDFYHKERKIILDAKYSTADRKEFIQQLFAYMFILDARHGGLIKPGVYKNNKEEIKRQSEDDEHAFWHDLFLEIPTSVGINTNAFIAKMSDNEKELMKYITDIDK